MYFFWDYFYRNSRTCRVGNAHLTLAIKMFASHGNLQQTCHAKGSDRAFERKFIFSMLKPYLPIPHPRRGKHPTHPPKNSKLKTQNLELLIFEAQP
jgi:hypothetical protein